MVRQDPSLYSQPFDQQMRTMWHFGFSSGYLFAPYMKQLGYESNFVVTNCRESQLKWAAERGIVLQYPEHWMYEVAWHQVNFYRPDVVFITEPLQLDSKFIKMLTYRPKVVLGWRASIIPAGTDWSEFDVILSNLSALRDIAVRLGAKSAQHFWPGFETRITSEVASTPITHDVVFCGQWTEHHRARNQLISDLVQADISGQLGYSLRAFISGDPHIIPSFIRERSAGARFGLDYYRALRSGSIALDARGTELYGLDPTTGEKIDLFKGETGTNRMLEVTGTGTLLMAEHYDVLSKYFEIGKEIETFRSKEELQEKVRYFKHHPAALDEIARRGHQRCVRDHSMEVRVAQLDEIIKRCLGILPKAVPHQPRGRSETLVAASRSLVLGDFKEVLRLLANIETEAKPAQGLFFTRGRAHLLLGQGVEARRDIEKEISLFPDHEEAKSALDRIQRGGFSVLGQSEMMKYDLVHSVID